MRRFYHLRKQSERFYSGAVTVKAVWLRSSSPCCAHHKEIQLLICGERKYWKYVIVQENKSLSGQKDLYGQFIAEARAAFQENNANRVGSGA